MTPNEWLALLTFTLATFPNFSNTQDFGNRKFYVTLRSEVRRRYGSFFSPPPWLFSIWLILHGLMSASAFLFWLAAYRGVIPSDSNFGRAFVVWAATVVVLKLWTSTYAGKRLGYAFGIVVVGLVGSVWFAFELGLAKRWLSFGLWIPLCIWLIYASVLAFLNWRTYTRRERSKGK